MDYSDGSVERFSRVNLSLTPSTLRSSLCLFMFAVGGNVGESQAAKLGSHFSLMMLVSIPSAHLDDLKASLNDVPGMNAAVFEATGGENKITPQIACTYCTV
jgi:glycine cleavage system regulatory protein